MRRISYVNIVKWVLCLSGMLPFVSNCAAQGSYDDRAKAYIRTYAAYAIEDQRNSGVPASITLGQGILETEAGKSVLAVKANNHFGIKCKNGWTGPTIRHTDDAKNECFKKYESALESYNDHSAHLHRNPRYKSLFTYSLVDYKKWAHGLKRCGYATNPKYAYQLIKIIEDYNLQEYTYAAIDSNYQVKLVDTGSTETTLASAEAEVPVQPTAIAEKRIERAVDSARDAIRINETTADIDEQWAADNASDVVEVNGLKAVQCKKGQPLLPIAISRKLRYAHLLAMNDLGDEPMPFDGYVYLEKKHTSGTKPQHVVKEGETLLQIAQVEGMQLKKLATLNKLTLFEQPETGAVLNLQTPATSKPALKRTSGIRVYTESEIAAAERQMPDTPVTARKWSGPANTTSGEASFGVSFEAPADKRVSTTMTVPEEEQPEVARSVGVPKQEITYVVKKGETAFSISKRYGVSVRDLELWNKIDARKLKVGQVLRIKNQ